MSRKLVLIGGGGHALSLIDIIPSSIEVAGYVDFSPSPLMTLPYLGDDSTFLATCSPEDYVVAITYVSGGDCSLTRRYDIIDRYKSYTSPAIISRDAIVSPSAGVGEGTMVFHRSVINASTTTGRQVIVNTGAIVEHGCIIGDNVFIGPGTVICGGVVVGDNTYIGAGAIVKPGVKICNGAVIGAGAVVIGDIDMAGTYVGVPAKLK